MENQSDSNYSSVFSTENTDHCRVDGECNVRSAVGSAVLRETGSWRAAILSWVQLGDLPALVKRYPEPMAHGPEACEPSHPCGSR